jgi:hypothetical protein
MTPTPSDAIPAALVEAMEARRRRRRAGRQWVILPNDSDAVEGLAASINSSRHQRLADRFRPEGYVTEFL